MILIWALPKSSVILWAFKWLRLLTCTLISVSGSSRAPKGLKGLINSSFSESALSELTSQMPVKSPTFTPLPTSSQDPRPAWPQAAKWMKLLASHRYFILPFNTAIILPEQLNPCIGGLQATAVNIQVFVAYVAVDRLRIYSQGPQKAWPWHGERNGWGWAWGEVALTCTHPSGPGTAVCNLLGNRTSEMMGRGRKVYLATGSKAMRTFAQIVFPIVQSF